MNNSTVLLIALINVGSVALLGCRTPAGTGQQGAHNRICEATKIDGGGLSTCYAVLEPYIRYDDPDAVAFNDLAVSLYFFPQTPPKEIAILKPIQVKAVVDADRGSCRDAGIQGLIRLQRLAQRRGANAVVNIRSTWARQQLGDDLHFGCRVTRRRFALIWEGTLARIEEPVGLGSDAGEHTPESDSTAGQGASEEPEEVRTRLRKLEALYYRGLITRKEFEQQRQKILDSL